MRALSYGVNGDDNDLCVYVGVQMKCLDTPEMLKISTISRLAKQSPESTAWEVCLRSSCPSLDASYETREAVLRRSYSSLLVVVGPATC